MWRWCTLPVRSGVRGGGGGEPIRASGRGVSREVVFVTLCKSGACDSQTSVWRDRRDTFANPPRRAVVLTLNNVAYYISIARPTRDVLHWQLTTGNCARRYKCYTFSINIGADV